MRVRQKRNGIKSVWTTRLSVGILTYPVFIYMQSLSKTAELNYKCSIVDQEFESHNNPVKLLLKGPIKENTNGSLRVTVGDKVQTFIRSYFYKYKVCKNS